MSKTKNPAAGERGRVSGKIAAIAKPLDTRNHIEFTPNFQAEALAAAAVMKKFGVSEWHARTVCALSGLGGQHA